MRALLLVPLEDCAMVGLLLSTVVPETTEDDVVEVVKVARVD